MEIVELILGFLLMFIKKVLFLVLNEVGILIIFFDFMNIVIFFLIKKVY